LIFSLVLEIRQRRLQFFDNKEKSTTEEEPTESNK